MMRVRTNDAAPVALTTRGILRYLLAFPLLSMLGALGGCHDLTCSQALPSGTADPASYNTTAGALGQRTAALQAWINTWPSVVVHTAALSDEAIGIVCSYDCGSNYLDQRILPAISPNAISTDNGDYSNLHQVRGLTAQAIGQLATYDSVASPALRGELYAASGYAEILLADLFCSGVPLSTLDFHHDYTYAPSSTVEQVYQDAIAKFDSALALSADSSRILNLARVGKGRALLDLGEYAQAAQAVVGVPDTFQYRLAVRWNDTTGNGDAFSLNGPVQQADREGGNGIAFINNGDPRSVAQDVTEPGQQNGFGDVLEPVKIQTVVERGGLHIDHDCRRN